MQNFTKHAMKYDNDFLCNFFFGYLWKAFDLKLMTAFIILKLQNRQISYEKNFLQEKSFFLYYFKYCMNVTQNTRFLHNTSGRKEKFMTCRDSYVFFPS